MSEELKPCPIKMVEIYGGKDSTWAGWHNLLVSDLDNHPIAGPLSPIESAPFLELIKEWNTSAEDKPQTDKRALSYDAVLAEEVK